MQEKKSKNNKKNNISLPKEDIKREEGQPTFLESLKKIVKKKQGEPPPTD